MLQKSMGHRGGKKLRIYPSDLTTRRQTCAARFCGVVRRGVRRVASIGWLSYPRSRPAAFYSFLPSWIIALTRFLRRLILCQHLTRLSLCDMTDDGHYLALADARYEAITGMYGGWAVAVILKTVILQSGQEFGPSALTINYVHKIEPGSEVKIEARLVGSGRSIQHWQAQIMEADGARTLAQCDAGVLLLVVKLMGTHNLQCQMCLTQKRWRCIFQHGQGGGPSNLPMCGQFMDIPAFARHDTTSMAWVREGEARKIDHVQLAFLSDLLPTSSFFLE